MHISVFSVAFESWFMKLQNEMCYFGKLLKYFLLIVLTTFPPWYYIFFFIVSTGSVRVDLFFELTVKDHRNSHGHQNHVSCERVYDNNHKSISGLITKKYFVFHSVEISSFLYDSDFTWNQFWGFLKCKISHFTTFRALNFDFLHSFEGWNLPFE